MPQPSGNSGALVLQETLTNQQPNLQLSFAPALVTSAPGQQTLPGQQLNPQQMSFIPTTMTSGGQIPPTTLNQQMQQNLQQHSIPPTAAPLGLSTQLHSSQAHVIQPFSAQQQSLPTQGDPPHQLPNTAVGIMDTNLLCEAIATLQDQQMLQQAQQRSIQESLNKIIQQGAQTATKIPPSNTINQVQPSQNQHINIPLPPIPTETNNLVTYNPQVPTSQISQQQISDNMMGGPAPPMPPH